MNKGWENIKDFKNNYKILDIDNCDGIFVLAGGINNKGKCHPWVINRLDLAIEYYHKYNQNIYCLGGGTYHKPPILNDSKFCIHESTSCAEYLISKGIPPNKIYKEWSSYDTIANGFFGFLHFIIPLKLKNIILITSNFHMNRSKAIFEWLKNIHNLDIKINYVIATDDDIDSELIQIRTKREIKSLDSFNNNIVSKINDFDTAHKWFYTEHKAYSSHSEIIRENVINEKEKDSY